MRIDISQVSIEVLDTLSKELFKYGFTGDICRNRNKKIKWLRIDKIEVN